MQKDKTKTFSLSLDTIIKHCDGLQELNKSDLQFGDLLGVRTQKSVYAIGVLEGDDYLVSGGWFDQHGLSPRQIAINGCTWGGSVIKPDIVAACGLCLEFSNGLVTSPIEAFSLFKFGKESSNRANFDFPGGNDHKNKNMFRRIHFGHLVGVDNGLYYRRRGSRDV